jgi:hypothetical protein
MERWEANVPRYQGGTGGHYESYFLRANHRDRALGFWIRYTIFVPAGDDEAAQAELWAAVFSDEPGGTVSVYEAVPLATASFAGRVSGLEVRIGPAVLRDDPVGRQGSLTGSAASGGHQISWDLAYNGGSDTLLLLAPRMYDRGIPRAKALVPAPMAVFTGRVQVDGELVEVTGWTGSQNHNWGSQHTDEYAWGQVAGFDDAPGSFLECSSARVRVAGLRTPWLTPLVLRHEGQEYALNSLAATRRARASYAASGNEYAWDLRSDSRDEAGGRIAVSARFRAPAESFVSFEYRNPPGGSKTCLNTKIAMCEATIEREGAAPVTLHSANRAAFEILG